MRHLILHRKRALASFALLYFCILNQEPEAFVAKLEADPATARFYNQGDYALRNGETLSIPINDQENTFFVAIYTESRNVVTNVITIAPGTQDVAYTIVTDYNGYDRLGYFLVENQ